MLHSPSVHEGRKRVLLIAAALLAARKLASYDPGSEFQPPCAPSRTPSAGPRRFWTRSTAGGRRDEGDRQGKKAIRAEHRKACAALKALIAKGTGAPLATDLNQYYQLITIKETLEWVHSVLIKTRAKRTDPQYLEELMEHKYYAHGPVDATLTWPRATFVD